MEKSDVIYSDVGRGGISVDAMLAATLAEPERLGIASATRGKEDYA